MKKIKRALTVALCVPVCAVLSCAAMKYVGTEFAKGSMYKEPGSTAANGASQQSEPASVYVTFRSHCSSTVKLFIGEKPPYSSGIETSVSGNSVDSRSIAPGTLVWILDESGKPISSTSVSAGTNEIHISSSCTGFGDN
jgi:hypothetical protein